MIEVKNLTKQYGSKTAVNGISFSVGEGEILGFLGPNGAGKSTTMNMLTGYISSTAGTAYIDGIDILEDPIAAKAKIGYLPEKPPVYGDMTVNEYLKFVYNLKKSKLPRESHLAEIRELMKIDEVKNRLIRNLSKGYQQRVGFAGALVGNPDVLILDEPTVGLDPKQIIEIRTLIKKLGKHHTVILSSHILPEVQAVCDRIVVISSGSIVANDTADALARNLSTDHKLIVRTDGDSEEIKKLLSSISGMERVIVNREAEPGVYEYYLETEENKDLRREISQKLTSRGHPILMMKSSEMSLEEIFLKLTTGDNYGGIEKYEQSLERTDSVENEKGGDK